MAKQYKQSICSNCSSRDLVIGKFKKRCWKCGLPQMKIVPQPYYSNQKDDFINGQYEYIDFWDDQEDTTQNRFCH